VSLHWVQKCILTVVMYPAVAAASACFLHAEHQPGGWFSVAPWCGGHSTNKPSVIISELDGSAACSSGAVRGAGTFWETSSGKTPHNRHQLQMPCNQKVLGCCSYRCVTPQRPADPRCGAGAGRLLAESKQCCCHRAYPSLSQGGSSWGGCGRRPAGSAACEHDAASLQWDLLRSWTPISSLLWLSPLSPGPFTCRV